MATIRALIILAALLATSGTATAQPVEAFYKGRTINVYIGFATGGTYDMYARLVARHMGRYIPGNPLIVAQSMPGAGSTKAANYVFAVAPKDGSALGVVSQTVAAEEK